MKAQSIYVIPNAHLDPVWLWPWRDGYSEAHNTIQSAVQHLKANKDMTFTCSSSSVYEWIEESNPVLFGEMKQLIAEGRFEVVGGWIVQSDTIISSGESLIRQAYYAKRYFKTKFDVDVKVAYSVDAFGHNAGLPKILAHSGFRYYVMYRPTQGEKSLPDIFWWEGSDNSRILTLRLRPTYNTQVALDRKGFSEWMQKAVDHGHRHQTFFMGVGDHGGGPTRRQIEWVRELQQKYDMKFSTLHDYFRIMEQQPDIPTVRGELTHHATGCYGVHSGIKRWISRCGKELLKAETLLALGGSQQQSDRRDMDSAWRNYLFNHFHDIYPGSAIESAYEDARDSLGGAADTANRIKIRELHRLAKRVDTSDLQEGGVFVFNPLPWRRKAAIEIDTFTDPNHSGSDFCSLKADDGTSYPIQWARAAVNYGPCYSKWGKLTALVDLPAMGYKTFSLEKSPMSKQFFEPRLPVKCFGQISFEILYDTYDVWGHNAAGRLGKVVGVAKLLKTETLEKGPVRCRFRAFYEYGASSVVLDLIHYEYLNFVQADVQLDWREVNHTLKMVIDTDINEGIIASEQAYDIVERRPDDREQPMQHWLAAVGETQTLAVISDSVYAYDSFGTGKIRFTLLRAVPYAVTTHYAHGDEGIIDLGRQSRRFWLATEKTESGYRNWLPRMSHEARFAAEYVMESNHPGDKPKNSGDQLVLKPDCLTLGACGEDDAGGFMRVYNNCRDDVLMELDIAGKRIDGKRKIHGNSIVTVPIPSGNQFDIQQLSVCNNS